MRHVVARGRKTESLKKFRSSPGASKTLAGDVRSRLKIPDKYGDIYPRMEAYPQYPQKEDIYPQTEPSSPTKDEAAENSTESADSMWGPGKHSSLWALRRIIRRIAGSISIFLEPRPELGHAQVGWSCVGYD